MLQNIVSVSAICLALAMCGWDRQQTNTFRGPDSDPDFGVNPSAELTAGERWGFQLPRFMGCCRLDRVACHPGIFRYHDCPESEEETMKKAGCVIWIGYKAVTSLKDAVYFIDNLSGNTATLILTSWAPFCLTLILRGVWNRARNRQRGQRVKRRDLERNKVNGRTNIPDSDTERRKIFNLQLIHRYQDELEIMARTIEFLQRDKLQEDIPSSKTAPRFIYPPLVPLESLDFELSHPVGVSAEVATPQNLGPSSSEEKVDNDGTSVDPDFVAPEFEWD